MKSPGAVLKEVWGYDAFRPLQEDIINAVLEGKDTLALLPTGGGKSICFQVPALCLEGLTLVISPLIALMRDQVDNLKRRNVSAAAIFSGMPSYHIDSILDNAVYGHYKLLYVSPERLQTEMFMARFEKMPISLLAIDEAHCISQWGYDFRPPYLEIASIRQHLPGVPVIALTATATPEVVKDIQHRLAFAKENVFEQSFERSNLAYIVQRVESKEAALLRILNKIEGTSIVYVRSRKRTVAYSRLLNQLGISADFYHAGLSPRDRTKKQEDWINNKVRVIAATNAFGMGIDKPDVRTVIHMDVPDSPEAYFQEAGRAGRDGQQSWTVLLYQDKDAVKLKEQFEQSYPPVQYIRSVYAALAHKFQIPAGSQSDTIHPFELQDFCKTFNFNIMEAWAALKLLQDNGFIELTESVYQPNQVIFLADKETLYDIQLRHPGMDKIIRTMLRLYQGIHVNEVNIRESQISKLTGIGIEEVKTRLRNLHQQEVLRYIEYSDKPGVMFTGQRLLPENLHFDLKKMEFLKTRHAHRLKTMLSYCNQPVCRSIQLLAYFGQKNAKPCGQCDVCKQNKKSGELNPAFVQYWQDKILKVLETDKILLNDWLQDQKEESVPSILRIISHMLDQGMLKMDGAYLCINRD